MSELIERGAVPEGYKVEVFDGRVIMTPQSPERDWTVSDVKDAVKASGIARERVFGDVLITFPGENDAAPDLTIVGFDAERRKNSYSCLDVLAVVEVPSEPEDEKDYVRNVRKYGRFGIRAGRRDPVRRAGRLHAGHRGAGRDRHGDLSDARCGWNVTSG
ncbi:Uma2 family endonuclease [Streptomyces sp. NRRL S-37]|uniref:Uma2 family endonuclease n=1 Tax=Streptomyces sp. NRRL S-37 TaxID=1463903 RepID=UPI001F303865|nr:Uma2 family endonuclease [Streptomyces sp. NRRL S-37]